MGTDTADESQRTEVLDAETKRLRDEAAKAVDRALGRNLRTARIHEGYSQGELADLVGMNQKTIGRLERGERPMTMDQMYKLCLVLKIKPSTLMAEVGI
ncbi:helix-turn-helix transcriptional regulator [Nocardia puris]|nr:helix-turn-helix transcriptional regulator [Nocardia puris]